MTPETIYSGTDQCTLQGNGDPNVNGVTLVGGCTYGVYLNSEYDSRNPSPTTFVWDAVTSTWEARP